MFFTKKAPLSWGFLCNYQLGFFLFVCFFSFLISGQWESADCTLQDKPGPRCAGSPSPSVFSILLLEQCQTSIECLVYSCQTDISVWFTRWMSFLSNRVRITRHNYFLAAQSGFGSLVVFKHLCPCRTTYGKEFEVTAHTFLDSHKAEQDENHWIMCTSDPAGSKLELVNNTGGFCWQHRLHTDNLGCTQMFGAQLFYCAKHRSEVLKNLKSLTLSELQSRSSVSIFHWNYI